MAATAVSDMFSAGRRRGAVTEGRDPGQRRGFSLPVLNLLLIACAVLIWFFGWWAVLGIAVAAIAMTAGFAIFGDGPEGGYAAGDDDWPSEPEYTLVLPLPVEEIGEKLRPALGSTAFSFAENAYNEYRLARDDDGWRIALRRAKNEPASPVHVTFKNTATGLERDQYERFGSALARSLDVDVKLLYELAWATTRTWRP
jgi:hypothetical protein